MEEAIDSDWDHYQSFGDFFRRRLKPGIRPIAESCLVCPSDGVLHRSGVVDKDLVEQVKGITYTLDEFLGPTDTSESSQLRNFWDGDARRHLFYCVLYLAPGDYHGFHSPADWAVKHRRHYAGYLLSVGKSILDRVPKLLCLNERVLLEGTWKHGYFSMTAVGATNVGNIVIDNENLKTNSKEQDLGSMSDRSCIWPREKGARVGEFRLGSTVVLIFEAPPTFHFTVGNGSRVKYGQSLGDVTRASETVRSDQ